MNFIHVNKESKTIKILAIVPLKKKLLAKSLIIILTKRLSGNTNMLAYSLLY
jgi:hypothetical protein